MFRGSKAARKQAIHVNTNEPSPAIALEAAVSPAAKTGLRLGLSLLILAIVFVSFDGLAAMQILAQIQLREVLLALGFAGVLFLLGACRWQHIAHLADIDLTHRRALVVILESHFFNQALPATLGGDAYRIWVLSRIPSTLVAAAGCVIADRIFGLLGLCVLAAASQYFLLFDLAGPDTRRLVGISLLAVAAIVAAIFTAVALRRVGRGRFAAVHRLFDNARLVARHPGSLLFVMLISIAGHVLLVGMYIALARGLGIEISALQGVAIFPTILLLAQLPITIAGWGVREALLATALSFLGVAPAASVALGIAFGLLMLIVAAPGALMWIRGPDRSAFEARNEGAASDESH